MAKSDDESHEQEARRHRKKSSKSRHDEEEESDYERESRKAVARKKTASDDGDSSVDNDGERKSNNGKRKHHRKSRRRHDDTNSDSDSSEEERRKKKRKYKKKSSRKHKKKRRRKHYSSTSEDSSSSDSDSDDQQHDRKQKKQDVDQKKLLEKLSARGETLEEREARRAKRREARVAAKFGYTADDNPFNDPNLHETFTWKKKEETAKGPSKLAKQDNIFQEIEKVRERRKNRELQFEEMERIRAEENRMKELENYDEWARKEEEFHLQQQRQRSAIRLVEGREKPVDVLAKNLLLFGLSDEDKQSRAKVKYQERYNALEELETLEAELEEPHVFLKVLKLEELEELLVDIDAFRTLEREASVKLAREGGMATDDKDNAVLKYWDALYLVTCDEIKYLKTGGAKGSHAQLVEDILKLFEKQSSSDLTSMRSEIEVKLRRGSSGGPVYDPEGGVMDVDYWRTVSEQLNVHLAKLELSDLHSKMLVRQLERLEKRKEEIQASKAAKGDQADGDGTKEADEEAKQAAAVVPKNVAADFGELEEELGLGNEVDVEDGKHYSWEDKYRPRKPRYFNRVKTGYDWNKYNQTHYDHDNPPPKIVQGYKFNIFYPDLIDKQKTPQYFLEKADSDEFCIIRFHAGPPYEDIAFKIINREWSRSRKRGFRSTFERGVLSLYFNFKTHWYRR